MKINYTRNDIHFKSLSEYNGQWNEAWGINTRLNDLADKLSTSYPISHEKILRLIRYVYFAYESSSPEIYKSIVTDYKQVMQFKYGPEPIVSVTFKTEHKQFTITNAPVIDELFNTLLNKMFETIDTVPKKNKKTLPEKGSIKKIATELFKELTQKENISEWRSYCIIGFIFAFYRFGIKYTGIIKTEERYNLYKEKHYKTESYLSYLAGNIRRYIIR
jgi:hypothetical protein